MDLSFDLDINNYGREDLLALFKLSPDFSSSDVDEKEQAIRVQLMTEDMPHQAKVKLNAFLEAAVQYLKKDWMPAPMLPNDLIPLPPVPYVPAKAVEYTRGDVNPYEKRTLTKLVNIDTTFRANYRDTTAADLQCTLPETLRNVVQMELDDIDLPFFWFPTFSADPQASNTFSVTLTNPSLTTSVTLTEGSFTSSELGDLAALSFAAAGLPFLMLESVQGKTILRARLRGEGESLYDTASSYYGPTRVLSVTFPSGANSVGPRLGFSNTSYVAEASHPSLDNDGALRTTFRNYIESEGYLRNMTSDYYYLEIDDFHNNFATNAITTNFPAFNTNNVFARIAVRDNRVTLSKTVREYMGPVRIEKLHLRLLNRYGAPVIFMKDFAVSLRFTIIYSKS
jgi:hypothetical protein